MGCADSLPRSIRWEHASGDAPARAVLIDQRRLPSRLEEIECFTHAQMIDAIKTLALRGAPAIGAGGAFALCLWARNESEDQSVESFMASLRPIADEVSSARPTAVNLSWAVSEMVKVAEEMAAGVADSGRAGVSEIVDAMERAACALADDDEVSNRSIGSNGAALFAELSERLGRPIRIMTHCNAGSLATVFYGTALGAVYSAFDNGCVERVYPCETRPVNQGGRLTTWELMHAGVPTTLICDNMAASTISAGLIDAVIVGADRIAANGDTANKIGTMGHAILASYFNIPFYVAAPFSTIDLSIPDGSCIQIEERDPDEVRGFFGSGIIETSGEIGETLAHSVADGTSAEVPMGGLHRMTLRRGADALEFDMWMRTTPEGVEVRNPAFDVTPASLIDAIVTDRGVFRREGDGSFCFE